MKKTLLRCSTTDDGVVITIFLLETKAKESSSKQTGIVQVASHLGTANNQKIGPQMIPALEMTPLHIG